ncbi:PLP-dependent aminotransferase family protein [Arthrobacter sp. Soil763]|uniref:aminotransferase-like domain-containing protein n=1 Tax=Arthrobacter sp. Soil763 TaxID=1736402 RepID=UPI0006FE3809|nr:PLP-dependent aminotransferase family protein [Arthrobacter sp. Soil763]KRE80125.1 GntR family transcriptional regulator [Arthrobacter sp. Soil763]
MSDNSSSRIAEALKARVSAAAPGTRLPSTRSLVTDYRASPITIQSALRSLAAQGLIESRPGVGTFVRHRTELRPADYGWQSAALGPAPGALRPNPSAMRDVPNDVTAFNAGYPDRELLPGRLVRAALARAARSDAAVVRPPAAGLPELQAWFAQELGASSLPDVPAPVAADVVILPGSQSGLSSLFRALVGPGQPLLMESPTYWGAILAAASAGVRIIPIPSGPNGPDVSELARAFEETGARAFYAQPTFANPTGAHWTQNQGDRVLDMVRQHGAFLIEDDWAHDFGITAEPAPLAARDGSGHVVYLRSLTKSLSPSLRVAAVIARGPARERIMADRLAESMYVSGLLQAAAVDVVTQSGWQAHLRTLKNHLKSRRDLLLDSLRDLAPAARVAHVPAGGLNLWARLPDGTDMGRLVRDCEASGVVIADGAGWFPAEASAPFLRLNYAGPNPAAFPRAARVLGEALQRNDG